MDAAVNFLPGWMRITRPAAAEPAKWLEEEVTYPSDKTVKAGTGAEIEVEVDIEPHPDADLGILSPVAGGRARRVARRLFG